MGRNKKTDLSKYGIVPIENCSLEVKLEDDVWMTSEEVTRFLKIEPKTLMNLVSLGKVPRYKLFNLNRYKRSEIEALITRPSIEEE